MSCLKLRARLTANSAKMMPSLWLSAGNPANKTIPMYLSNHTLKSSSYPRVSRKYSHLLKNCYSITKKGRRFTVRHRWRTRCNRRASFKLHPWSLYTLWQQPHHSLVKISRMDLMTHWFKRIASHKKCRVWSVSRNSNPVCLQRLN